MTKLEAVNYVLTAVGLRAVGALETGTASTAADIEREIDRRVKVTCEENWNFNRRLGVRLTPDANSHILVSQIGEVVSSGIITGITASATPVITSKAHGFLSSIYVVFSGTDCTPALTTNPSTGQPFAATATSVDEFTLTVGQVTTTGSGTVGYYNAINPGTILEIRTSDSDSSRSVVLHNDRLYDIDKGTDVFSGTLTVRYTLLYTFDQLPPKVQTYVAAESAVWFNKSYGQRERTQGLMADAMRARARARGADSRIANANVLAGQNVQETRGFRMPFPGVPYTGNTNDGAIFY